MSAEKFHTGMLEVFMDMENERGCTNFKVKVPPEIGVEFMLDVVQALLAAGSSQVVVSILEKGWEVSWVREGTK